MKFVITLLLGILLSGCSLDLSGEDNTRPVRIQSIRTSGVDPVSVIDASSLQTGDILLSSSTSLTSLTSWGIRLFSTAGVSHAALYIGENQVAEAVGKGIKIITLEEAMQESNNLLALRLASLTPEQANTIRSYTLAHQGEKYNYKGIVMFAPFMLTRRVCELPLMGVTFRDRCLTTLASVQLAPSEAEQPSFFCSQFVVAAFAAAHAPLFKGDAQWLSPADLLHMRDGDVTAYDIPQPLNYVGHLKRWDLKEILSLRRATP